VYSIERLKTVLKTAPLISSSGYSYRVIEDRWRNDPLSAIGALQNGGRYNAPGTFSLLYTANSRITAFKETQALFDTEDGQLQDVPRNPELVLTLEVTLSCVIDLTNPDLCAELGTSAEELVSTTPSRFILNSRGKTTPTQDLGAACYLSQRISALKVPSAAHSRGFCINIFPDRLFVGERVAIRDEHHRLRDEIDGKRQLHEFEENI
jgi:RES domain-containing protein